MTDRTVGGTALFYLCRPAGRHDDLFKEIIMFLGIPDAGVASAFIMLIVSVLVCAVYGIVNWNRGDLTMEELEEERCWFREELEIDEEISGGI